jgi:hypothetical protein
MTQEAISSSMLAGLQAEAEKAKAASSPAVAIELDTRALELAAASPERLAWARLDCWKRWLNGPANAACR